MTVTTTRDNNGDGIVDQIDLIQRHVDGSSVETVTDFVAGTMTDRTILTTSADGLTKTTQQDLTGNSTIARTRSDVTVINLDGSRTETIIDTNADGSLHQKGVTTTSADGRTRTLEEDTTGAGFTNHTELTTVAADGSSTTDARDLKKAGTLVSETITSVSADGRSKTTKTDSTGTHVFDHIEDPKTNIDGSTITNATDYNADSNVKERQVTTTSADGRVKVIQIRYPEHRQFRSRGNRHHQYRRHASGGRGPQQRQHRPAQLRRGRRPGQRGVQGRHRRRLHPDLQQRQRDADDGHGLQRHQP